MPTRWGTADNWTRPCPGCRNRWRWWPRCIRIVRS
jgi:hypothetical protein